MAAKRIAKKNASRAKAKESSTRAKAVPPRLNKRSADKDDSICPIVGIGGSAGGFEATMELLRHLPAKNGMAFVIVQHLDPHHASKLASLLGKVSAMPVIEVEKTTKPDPGTVYVQPSNKCVVVNKGSRTLLRR